MPKALDNLIDILTLEKINDTVYRGKSEDLGWGRVYGGQVLSQSVVASNQTVQNRILHSFHGYFLRPGHCDFPIDYKVTKLRDGGSFSVRQVSAVQQNLILFESILSYQKFENGLEHQLAMPNVPPPEDLIPDSILRKNFLIKNPHFSHPKNYCRQKPLELRYLFPVMPLNEKPKNPSQFCWFKTVEPIENNPALHQAILTYISDWGLLGVSLMPHAQEVFSPNIQSASLDHAMWFHDEFQIDDWLLYVKESPRASNGRGFSRGLVYTRTGKLVASTCQEGLIRSIKK
jgi:acyl-CoA thioesterase-2